MVVIFFWRIPILKFSSLVSDLAWSNLHLENALKSNFQKKGQVSSEIHSARPTVSTVANIVFAKNLFCFVKNGDVRTDDMCGNNDDRPLLWVGIVDQKPFVQASYEFFEELLWSCLYPEKNTLQNSCLIFKMINLLVLRPDLSCINNIILVAWTKLPPGWTN